MFVSKASSIRLALKGQSLAYFASSTKKKMFIDLAPGGIPNQSERLGHQIRQAVIPPVTSSLFLRGRGARENNQKCDKETPKNVEGIATRLKLF